MSIKTVAQLIEEDVPDIPYILKPLLTKQGKLLVFAPYWHYKTMFLMHLTAEMADGASPFNEWKVNAPTQSLFIEQELGPFGCRARYKRIIDARGSNTAGYNIFIVPKDRDIKLDQPIGFARLKSIIKAIEPTPAVLVLDPIRKFYRGGERDEDDSSTVTKVIEAMDELIKEFKVSIIFSHHEGHPGEQGSKGHPRGSSVWMDEADGAIALSKPIPGNHKRIRITYKKVRHEEMPHPDHFDVEFDKDTFTFNRMK